MLKVFNEFPRRPGLLARLDAVARCYSASAVSADVLYRTGVMDSAIKSAFKAKVAGQPLTVQLSRGDLVDPLKALEWASRATSSSSTRAATPRPRCAAGSWGGWPGTAASAP